MEYFGLFFEVGCGKSRTLIEMLEQRFWVAGRVLKTVILTPLIVVENFKREFEQYGQLSKGKVLALTGPMDRRLKDFRIKAQNGNYILITNYEMLYNTALCQEIFQWKPEVFVADEVHRLKDPKTKRTKRATNLADICMYRFGLSGTPILNTQLDLFSQIRILDGGKTFGKNFFVFRSQYFYDANSGRRGTHSYFPMWLPRPGIDAELQRRIQPFTMRVLKKDALDLPELVRKDFLVDLGSEQERAYCSMKKDFIAFLNDKACVASMALTKALRLQQIVSGFIKMEDASEICFQDLPRLAALQTLLEDITPTAKVIVWACFKKNYEMIENICKQLKVGYAMLHGETTDKQVQIDTFQNDGKCRIMVANPGAGGIGINLTAASYMIYYSKTWSLEHELQSEARAHRGGSEIHDKITRIDLVAKGTIDEVITETLNKKKKTSTSVLDDEIVNILKKCL